ncbi:MAG: sugar kinase [Burkholderiaceae bacterium]|nr:sugar kinase [Burkholderiaceae bacterium]
MSMPQHIICLGKSTLDRIWPLPSLPTTGGKYRATGYLELGGGMAATAAVAVARLGAKASFCGCAGDDAAGQAMRSELTRYGVDVTQFRLFPDARSSVSAVIVSGDGERMIVNFSGENIPQCASWLEVGNVATAGAVLADVRWAEGASTMYAAAQAHGIPTVLDGEAAHADTFAMLLPLVDHAIFSLPGLRSFSGDRIVDHAESLQNIRELGCRIAAVTLGAQGALWLDERGLHHQPAFATKVVDTTGAGDVFHGAYALALAEGMDVPTAMRFSSGVAALKCSHYGGRAGIPERAEVEQFLSRMP